MTYKNTSLVTKTFYGVEFKPGDIKEVTGHINDYKMIKVDSMPKEPPSDGDSLKKTDKTASVTKTDVNTKNKEEKS